MEKYKRKRLETLQEEIDTINDGSHPVLRKKFVKADRDRNDKLDRAARRRDCTLEVARLGTQKEMDDIRDWWKGEAKRVKDELYSKICDSVDVLKRELNVWDGPEDNLGNIARKLRDRGTDGKAAETEKAKKKKGLLNAGYVFGAHFVRKAGYRIEGEDRITLGKMEAEQDIYQIQKDWDTLNNRRSVRAARKDQ